MAVVTLRISSSGRSSVLPDSFNASAYPTTPQPGPPLLRLDQLVHLHVLDPQVIPRDEEHKIISDVRHARADRRFHRTEISSVIAEHRPTRLFARACVYVVLDPETAVVTDSKAPVGRHGLRDRHRGAHS